MQRLLRHFRQRVGRTWRQRIADARLNVTPPAVIGTAEANQVGPARVIAGELHRLHHRLGAGHVERHLVQTGNPAQLLDVVGDDGMIRSKHRSKIAHPLRAAIDTRLVEVISEKIDAVRTRQVIQDVAVKIAEGYTGRGFDKRACGQRLPHDAAILEGYAIGVGQLKIGGTIPHLRCHRAGPRELVPVERRKPTKPVLPQGRDLLRRVVRPEEPMLIIFVERDQRRDAPRHPGMSGQGAMLRPRQIKPLREPGKQQEWYCHVSTINRGRSLSRGSCVNCCRPRLQS